MSTAAFRTPIPHHKPAEAGSNAIFAKYMRAKGSRAKRETNLKRLSEFIQEHLPGLRSGVFATPAGIVVFMRATLHFQKGKFDGTFDEWLKARGYQRERSIYSEASSRLWVAVVKTPAKDIAQAGQDIEELLWYARFERDSYAPRRDREIMDEIRASHEALAKFGLTYQAKLQAKKERVREREVDLPQAILDRMRPSLN